MTLHGLAFYLIKWLCPVGLWLWVSVACAVEPVEGKPAPWFESALLTGEHFKLQEHRGEVVVIHFWATWCPVCREEMPAFDRYYQAHDQQGLRLIAVSMDDEGDAAKVQAFARQFHFDTAYAATSRFKEYGRVWRLPLTFVVDREGVLRKDAWYGKTNGLDLNQLENVLTPLLREARREAPRQ